MDNRYNFGWRWTNYFKKTFLGKTANFGEIVLVGAYEWHPPTFCQTHVKRRQIIRTGFQIIACHIWTITQKLGRLLAQTRLRKDDAQRRLIFPLFIALKANRQSSVPLLMKKETLGPWKKNTEIYRSLSMKLGGVRKGPQTKLAIHTTEQKRWKEKQANSWNKRPNTEPNCMKLYTKRFDKEKIKKALWSYWD